MKEISGGYINIEWNEGKQRFAGYQDSFEVDLSNNVSKLSLQLLFNSNSIILNEIPAVIKNLPKSIGLSTIEQTYFIDDGEVLNNVRQFLYLDNLIFSYCPQDFNDCTNVVYRKINNNVFVVIKEDQLQYVVVTKVDEFNFKNIENFNVTREIKAELLNLYFRLYTYNQENNSDILKLLEDLKMMISEKPDLLNSAIIKFLTEELEYLEEEMD